MSSRGLFTSSVLASVVGAGFLVTLAVVGSTPPVQAHPRITTTLLWKKDIAPILQRRCFSCHSPNNVAFSLASYAEARPWAVSIREEILTRHMPPWGAVAGYGRFQNDPSPTQGEWDLLVAWVDGGAPSGQTLEEEQVPPVFAATAPTWERGEPDLAIEVAAASPVRAGAPYGVTPVEIVTPFTSERRVHGLAFKPGDRRVVRWASVYEAGSGRWLFTYTPWSTSMHLPEGVAYTLPAGATLRVEVAYVGTEDDVSDVSEIGFYFEDAGEGEVATVKQFDAAPLDLAPGAEPTRTRGELVLDEATAIHAVWPDLDAGTGSLELTAYLPDGGVRPLLWLREYQHEWRSPYVYTDPVPLPRGTRLVMTAYAGNQGSVPAKVRPRLSVVRVPPRAATF